MQRGRSCSADAGRVISHDRLGGLHHRYDRLPELMSLTLRRHARPLPQYIVQEGLQPAKMNESSGSNRFVFSSGNVAFDPVSHRFAACWNERPEYVASRLPAQSGLRPAMFMGRTYLSPAGIEFWRGTPIRTLCQ